MNFFASPECSSGCESGWTLYFEHSHLSPNPTTTSHRNTTKFADGNGRFCDGDRGKKCVKQDYEEEQEEEEEEEDLSMVSDASSGPPHFNEDEGYFSVENNNACHYTAPKASTLPKNSSKRLKSKEKRCRLEQDLPSSFLDDTASSPVFNFSSKNNFSLMDNQASMESILDYSQGFSTTHFQGRDAYQDHCGYFQSSISGNQFQNNQWL